MTPADKTSVAVTGTWSQYTKTVVIPGKTEVQGVLSVNVNCKQSMTKELLAIDDVSIKATAAPLGETFCPAGPTRRRHARAF